MMNTKIPLIRLNNTPGADIIIARRYQTKLIKSYTNIPVVEMRFHAQEIGLLIQRAKRVSHQERLIRNPGTGIWRCMQYESCDCD